MKYLQKLNLAQFQNQELQHCNTNQFWGARLMFTSQLTGFVTKFKNRPDGPATDILED